MQLSEIYGSQSVAINRTEVESNRIPYLGEAFFPNRRKAGIDLGWIKTHKGLSVALKPSNFDAQPTIRPRGQVTKTKESMPFFRESMIIKEHDMMEIARITDQNDPYLQPVLESIYSDANELIDGADTSAERMRMQLLSANEGKMGIAIGTADNMVYSYNYDDDGSWKASHYLELLDNAKWSNTETAKPLTDIQRAITALEKIGVRAAYVLGTGATFDYLIENTQVKNALITSMGTAISFIDKDSVEEVIRRKLKVELLPYDKMFTDYDGTEKKFYPDDYITIIGSGTLGNTWYGTTPEEVTARGNYPQAAVDITVMDRGIAIAVQNEYKPAFTVTTTASQICLPSFEGMDSIYVIKVN